MKKISRLFTVCFVALLLASFAPADPRLVGKWKGDDHGDVGYVVFEKDSTAYFLLEGVKMGGKNYDMEGHLVTMTYVVNDSVIPRAVDFIVTENATRKEAGRMTGIYEFITNDKMKLAINFDGTQRPKSFDLKDSPDQLVFVRTKQ